MWMGLYLIASMATTVAATNNEICQQKVKVLEDLKKQISAFQENLQTLQQTITKLQEQLNEKTMDRSTNKTSQGQKTESMLKSTPNPVRITTDQPNATELTNSPLFITTNQPNATEPTPSALLITTSKPGAPLTRMYKPVVNHYKRWGAYIQNVAALPGGEAYIFISKYNKSTRNWNHRIERLNSTGQTTQVVYNRTVGDAIGGLLVIRDNLHVVHTNGTVIQVNIHDGLISSVVQIDNVGYVRNYGCLSAYPDKIPDNRLLLTDYGKGEVFTFNLSTLKKVVHLKQLKHPSSVSYLFIGNDTLYVVCEFWGHRLSIYNATWDLVRTIGNIKSGNGKLILPNAAIVTPENTLIVTHSNTRYLSEFDSQGNFLRHFLYSPTRSMHFLSFNVPYLWMSNGGNTASRVKLYDV